MQDMITCPHCEESFSDFYNYCTNCGKPKPKKVKNHCLNPNCVSHKSQRPLDSSIKYCGYCGSATVVGKEIENLL